MKKTTLLKSMLLLCALIVGSTCAWADSYTLSLSSEKKIADTGLVDGYVEWSIVNNDATIGSYQSEFSGQQFGTGSTKGNVVLSTPDINGTITNVTVKSICGKSGGATVAVSVGGNTYETAKSMKVATDADKVPGSLSFAGSSSGTVQITLTQTAKKAMYLNQIVITYTESKTAKPKFSLKDGFYYKPNVSIITLTTGAKIYYTIDGTEPSSESTLYTTPISLTSDTNLKAIAITDGLTDSDVTTASYTVLSAFPARDPKDYGTNYYVKVTDVNELENGDAILLVNQAGTKVMAGQGSTSRNTTDVTSFNGVISTVPGTAQKVVLIKTGNRFIFSTADNSYLYASSSSSNHLKTANEATAGANALASIDINASGDATITFLGENTKNSLRYNGSIVSCYSSGQYPAQIYKEMSVPGPANPTTSEDETYLTTSDNMAGWRAFNPDGQGYTLDANTTAYIVTANPSDSKIALATIAEPSGDIPGNTCVLLHTTSSADSHKMTLTKKTVADYSGDENKLKASTGALANVYRLGFGADGVAFYPYSGTPSTGTVYLNVSSLEAHSLTFDFDGGATSIGDALKAMNEKSANAVYYNLAGQRVVQPTKGLYIVNGKKIIIK